MIRNNFKCFHIVRKYCTVTSKFLNKLKKKKFVDTLRITVHGGSGGQGLPNFGGMGGRGGNVYVVGSQNASLKKIQTENLEIGGKNRIVFKAESGGNSKKFQLLGDAGKDVEIEIPPGVSISTVSGKYLGEVLNAGEKLLVAKGGEGGNANNKFKHSRGHTAIINLDLKLIADVGMVGFPNAGKSSLIKSLSRMNVKIKPFPFTTLHPQIGTLNYKDTRQISIADLPGLVEGAHENYGLGHSFLKHIERTKLLLFVVDLHGFQFKVHSPNRNAFETVLILLKEMELTKKELLSKPAVLALNKTDIKGSEVLLKDTIHKINNVKDYLHEVDEELHPNTNFKFEDVIGISARSNININILKQQLRTILDVFEEKEHESEVVAVNEEVQKNLERKLTEHATKSVSLV